MDYPDKIVLYVKHISFINTEVKNKQILNIIQESCKIN